MALNTFLSDLQSMDKSIAREAALAAGEALAVEAVPQLLTLLQSENLGLQEAAEDALKKIGGQATIEAVLPLLRFENVTIRNIAMDILRCVGGQYFQAIHELVHDPDSDIRIFSAELLGLTGEIAALEPLCQMLLSDSELNVRHQAAVSLGILGSPEATTCLREAMQDEEWVQYAVIEALAKIKHPDTLEVLNESLENSSDLVRSMIVDSLGTLGNMKSVEILLKQLDTASVAMCNKIIKAILDILGTNPLTLPDQKQAEKIHQYMIAALQDTDEELQNAAIRGLEVFGGEAATLGILDLAASLDPDSDMERLSQIAESLARIGLNTALTEALQSLEFGRTWVSICAMGFINEAAAARHLIAVFPKKYLVLQRLIASILEQYEFGEVQEFFLQVLKTYEDGKILKSALRFLGKNVQDKEICDFLRQLLDHEYADVRETALHTCIQIDCPHMLDIFKKMATDSNPIQRQMGIYALARMDGIENFAYLKVALADEDIEVRKTALKSLALQSESAKQCLELVTPHLHDVSREVRLCAVDFLAYFPDEDVLEPLLAVLDDPDPWVRIRAFEILIHRNVEECFARFKLLFQDADTLLLIRALKILGELEHPMAFELVNEVAKSSEPELALAAQELMEKMSHTERGK